VRPARPRPRQRVLERLSAFGRRDEWLNRVEWAHVSHSSARHLLSGAVVYLFKAKSSYAAAWSLGEKSATKPEYQDSRHGVTISEWSEGALTSQGRHHRNGFRCQL
jgi:hypothetical protein